VSEIQLTEWSDASIIDTFQQRFRGLAEYYKFAVDRGDLCLVKHVMEVALVKTLVYLSMISGANFSSGSGPAIPLHVSLLLRFGGHVTTKKGTT
jgi:hypothetical protein